MAMPRADGSRWSQRLPSMWISPALTSSSPAIIRSSVDLPQPDGPTNTVKAPSSTAEVDAVDDFQRPGSSS